MAFWAFGIATSCLPVDLPPMTNCDNEHNQPLVFDPRHKPPISHSVAPKAGQRTD